MRYYPVIVLLTIGSFGCAQTSLQLTQGVWEEEVDDFSSYVVAEENHWYSIIEIDGEIDVTKGWFGFYDNFEADSLLTISLKDSGKYLVFLSYRKSIKNYSVSLPRKYFNFYSYDLDEDYFIYYGNNPVTLNKVEALPAHLQKVFEKKKAELADIRFSEDQ